MKKAIVFLILFCVGCAGVQKVAEPVAVGDADYAKVHLERRGFSYSGNNCYHVGIDFKNTGALKLKLKVMCTWHIIGEEQKKDKDFYITLLPNEEERISRRIPRFIYGISWHCNTYTRR